MIRRSMTRRMITGLVGACAVAAATIGAGHAAADESVYGEVGVRCYSLNPNVFDFPSYAGIHVQRRAGDNTFTMWGDSKSFFRYYSDTRVAVTQLSNGATRTYNTHWVHTIADDSGYRIDDIPGRGKVKITINAVNRGLLTLRAPECSGVVDLQ
ncbi:hypothetical protein RND64_01880 [Gordonia sp. w5E2]|uniref:Secreted protein n=1 Tax=Gordonia jacobaea TaxID=122202 RepID=A0ABR5I7Q2_9ACTN|nr:MULTISPECIES: hypothetical protein [Gordonia]KNA89719.1 hypothetical protein ABW18_18650 [Gordonia jacobaea]SKZ99840.1 Uncharacterised protein [Mycobacteroides abscessus subsp. abscessus]